MFIICQESNIKIPSRAVQLISEVYEDSKGIDYQRVYRRLEKAQAKTGRDSVNARHVVADRSLYNQVHILPGYCFRYVSRRNVNFHKRHSKILRERGKNLALKVMMGGFFSQQ